MPVSAVQSKERAELIEFSAALAPLASICRPPLTEAQVLGYFAVLGDIPARVLLLAASQIAMTRKYPTFPMPGEIREIAVEIMQGARMTAGEAWSLALKTVRKFGLPGSAAGLASLPPAASEALAYFGWERLCNTRDGELGTAASPETELQQMQTSFAVQHS